MVLTNLTLFFAFAVLLIICQLVLSMTGLNAFNGLLIDALI